MPAFEMPKRGSQAGCAAAVKRSIFLRSAAGLPKMFAWVEIEPLGERWDGL